MKFIKRPIEIEAQRMKKAFTVETIEGVMQGEAGDWLITGVEGEQYPCKNSVFVRTYTSKTAEGLEMLLKASSDLLHQPEADLTNEGRNNERKNSRN